MTSPEDRTTAVCTGGVGGSWVETVVSQLFSESKSDKKKLTKGAPEKVRLPKTQASTKNFRTPNEEEDITNQRVSAQSERTVQTNFTRGLKAKKGSDGIAVSGRMKTSKFFTLLEIRSP